MKDASFFRRFVIPLCIVVGIMAAASLIFHGARLLAPGTTRTVLLWVFGPLMFVSIWFFGFVGTPVAYFSGARFIERLIVAFANPVIWITRMMAKVSCQFSPIELVYFFLLPWTFGLVCMTLLEFSVSDLACRAIDRRRSRAVRVLSPAVLVLLVLGLAGTYFGFVRGQEWVYMIVHSYALHFLP
jgi:Zn-dependent protease with chaperone function